MYLPVHVCIIKYSVVQRNYMLANVRAESSQKWTSFGSEESPPTPKCCLLMAISPKCNAGIILYCT